MINSSFSFLSLNVLNDLICKREGMYKFKVNTHQVLEFVIVHLLMQWLSGKPSIHFLYPLNPSVRSWGCRSLSQRSLGEKRGTPWTGRQSITGPHRDKRDTQPHSLLRTILETPINLKCMFLGGGKKPGVPGEKTHAYTGRTCKLHIERPQLGIEPGTLLL